MSSTNKTPNLRLNNWLESDKPKRADFVADNSIIDSVLGSHISDNNLHLTLSEKHRVSSPYTIFTNYGSGENNFAYNIDFEPKMVVIFKADTPVVTTVSNSPKVNFAIVTPRGSTGGAALSGSMLTVRQSSTLENGVFYNLNEEDAAYVIICFR